MGRWCGVVLSRKYIEENHISFSFLQSTAPYEYIVVGWILDPFGRLIPIQFSVFSIIMSGCEICLLLWILRSIGNIIQVMAPILAKIENLLYIQEREHPEKLQNASCICISL